MAMQDQENDHQQANGDATETTTLLGNNKSVPNVQATEAVHLLDQPSDGSPSTAETDKSLPKLQLFVLCYARMIEPIAFFSVFPYLNQMIWETGEVNYTDIGFYTGLIESLFSLTQMIVMIPWGKATDRFGRKPILVISMAGISGAIALFGFSQTIWQMLLFRCFAGVFAGSVVTIRVMITENSTKATQARAFSFFALAGNMGIFIGPLLGGALAKPAGQYPKAFGHIQFFKDYPYALPTIVTGAVGLTAVAMCIVFLKETIPKSNSKTSDGNDGHLSTWQVLKSPGVPMVLYIHMHVMLLAFAYTAVVPIFWFTKVSLGGFGFDQSPLLISIFMALAGFSQAVWLVVAFPPLQRRFGTGGVLRACAIAYPFFFLTNPLLNLILRYDQKTLFWALAPICLVLGSGVSMAFTCVQLAINDICPTPQTMGVLNALNLTLLSGLRAFSPALFTAIFAWGIKLRWLGGSLIWVVLTILALGYTLVSFYLPAKAEGKYKDDNPDEEES